MIKRLDYPSVKADGVNDFCQFISNHTRLTDTRDSEEIQLLAISIDTFSIYSINHLAGVIKETIKTKEISVRTVTRRFYRG